MFDLELVRLNLDQWVDVALVCGTLLAVSAAFWQAAISRGVARRQLRAYVEILAVDIIEGKPDGFDTFRISVRNYGQTPAHQCLFEAGFAVSDHLTSLVTPPKTVPPGGEVHYDIQLHDRAQRAAIRDRTAGLGIAGQIRYFDIFDRRQGVDFVMSLDPVTGKLVAAPGNLSS